MFDPRNCRNICNQMMTCLTVWCARCKIEQAMQTATCTIFDISLSVTNEAECDVISHHIWLQFAYEYMCVPSLWAFPGSIMIINYNGVVGVRICVGGVRGGGGTALGWGGGLGVGLWVVGAGVVGCGLGMGVGVGVGGGKVVLPDSGQKPSGHEMSNETTQPCNTFVRIC